MITIIITITTKSFFIAHLWSVYVYMSLHIVYVCGMPAYVGAVYVYGMCMSVFIVVCKRTSV